MLVHRTAKSGDRVERLAAGRGVSGGCNGDVCPGVLGHLLVEHSPEDGHRALIHVVEVVRGVASPAAGCRVYLDGAKQEAAVGIVEDAVVLGIEEVAGEPG